MTGLVKSRFVEGTVESVVHWSEQHLSLKVEMETEPFQPGQFVRLQLNIDGEYVARSYSLVNAPGEPLQEFYFNTVPSGRFSTALARLKPGDIVQVSQPANGFFVLDEVPEARELWMFATGTGIGPFVSMIRHGELWQRFEHCILVHAASHSGELAYRQQMLEVQQQFPGQFSYLACVTQENFAGGLGQRFTTALDDTTLESALDRSLSADRCHVMLCGNHHMLDDMKQRLGQRGMQKHLRHKPGHITTEQYF